jgi:hypothetical protein
MADEEDVHRVLDDRIPDYVRSHYRQLSNARADRAASIRKCGQAMRRLHQRQMEATGRFWANGGDVIMYRSQVVASITGPDYSPHSGGGRG